MTRLHVILQVPKDLWPVGPFGNTDSTETRRYGWRREGSGKSRFNASRIRQEGRGKLDRFIDKILNIRLTATYHLNYINCKEEDSQIVLYYLKWWFKIWILFL